LIFAISELWRFEYVQAECFKGILCMAIRITFDFVRVQIRDMSLWTYELQSLSLNVVHFATVFRACQPINKRTKTQKVGGKKIHRISFNTKDRQEFSSQ